MSAKPRRVLGVIAGAAIALGGGVVLGVPFASRAQQPATPSTSPPVAPAAPGTASTTSGYVGAETCKGCHEEAFRAFAKTRMGRLFLHQARDPKEGNACESCHGPGQAHVEAGGGKGKGGLITFAKNDRTPVEKRNQVCLDCHTKRARIFWKGRPARVSRRGLHQLPQGNGGRLAQEPARQADRDRDVRQLPHPEAGPDD